MSSRELRQLIAANEEWLRRPENQGQAIIVPRLRSSRDHERFATSDGHQTDRNDVTERRGRQTRAPPRHRGQEENRERSRSPLRPVPVEPSRTREERTRDENPQTGISADRFTRPTVGMSREDRSALNRFILTIQRRSRVISMPERRGRPGRETYEDRQRRLRYIDRIEQIRLLPGMIVETAEDESHSCSICISNYQIGEEIRELPCKHVFHHNCISQWFYKNDSCPLCRSTGLNLQGT